jgi:hypothetical protein
MLEAGCESTSAESSAESMCNNCCTKRSCVFETKSTESLERTILARWRETSAKVRGIKSWYHLHSPQRTVISHGSSATFDGEGICGLCDSLALWNREPGVDAGCGWLCLDEPVPRWDPERGRPINPPSCCGGGTCRGMGAGREELTVPLSLPARPSQKLHSPCGGIARCHSKHHRRV